MRARTTISACSTTTRGCTRKRRPRSRRRSSSTRRCRSRSATSKSRISTRATTTAASRSCVRSSASASTIAMRAGSSAVRTRCSASRRKPLPSSRRCCAIIPTISARWCSSVSRRRRAAISGSAQHWFEDAVRLDPASSVTRFYLGEVLYNQGRIDEALDALKRAIELNPENPDAHFLLSFVYGDMGRHEEARAASKRAVAAQSGALARAGESFARPVQSGQVRGARCRRITSADRSGSCR